MVTKQGKHYHAGQTKPNGGGVVQQGTRQAPQSGKQSGKTHAVKNLRINHGRRKG
jgi:hypothetical protein